MAIDQTTIPRDVRPSNPGSKKVKLLCSFGGRILPRPGDGALRYAGGHTRIVALSRDASLQDLARKVSDAYGGAAVLKYQLPGEDLDALVSVSCHEDLENMMEEYDKLAGASPDGSAKLRVFLFSPAEVDGSDLGLGPEDALDGGQRYVEAVNGIANVGVGGIRRKDSVASVSSTQTSDGGGAAELVDGAADGMPPAIAPPVFAAAAAGTSHDSSGSVCSGVGSDPLFSESTNAAFPVNMKSCAGVPPMILDSSQMLQQLTPQACMEPVQDGFKHVDCIQNPSQIHYVDSQQSGLAGVPVGFVAAPQHSYPPAVHIATAMPSSQVSRGQPVQGRLETCLDDVSWGGRIAQVVGDPTYKPRQALSQLPPLPPSLLQGQNVERHCFRRVPPVVATPGQSLRLEECGLCQRALPHAHSDPWVQDHVGSGSMMGVPNKSPVFYSLHSETASTHALHGAGNGSMPDTTVEHQPYNIVPPHSGAYGYSQIPELQKDVNIAPQGAENLDQTKVLFPAGLGFTTPQASHGLYFNNHSHAWSEDILQQLQQPPFGPPQYLRKQDPVVIDSVGVDISSARNETVQNSELSVQDTGFASACDYTKHAKMEAPPVNQFQTSGLKEHQTPTIKPYLGDSAPIMEALYVNPSETSVIGEPWKMVIRPDFGASTEVNLENLRIVEENTDNSKPKVGKKDTFLGSTAVCPSIAVDANSFKPVDLLPSSMLEVTCLQNFQPGDSNEGYPIIGNVGPYSHHLELGSEPPLPPERLLQGPSATAKVLTRSDWKDENSQLYSGSNSNDVSAPLQSSSVSTYNMHAVGVQGPVSSDSLFSNIEPWQIVQNSYLPSLKPVASRYSLLPRESCIDNHLRGNDESSIAEQLEDGSYHLLLDSLSNDTSPDMIHHIEGFKFVKHELQTVADGLAEPVVRQPIPVSGSYAHENDSAAESNEDRGIGEDSINSHSVSQLFDHKAEEVKVGQLDTPNLGVQVVEDIGHLQIIKNSDLEELRELGSGTFGTVYHGKWRGSDVAIKRINDRYFAGKQSEQERSRADFWNEACKLADLHHPNVVAFYGVVLDGPGGSMATVTEYMVNGSLRQALQKNDKNLDHRKRLLIAMDVAFGMEYLHGKNIVHFDLKSDNLLVNLRDPQRPICKVGDLGLSKVKRQTLISGGVRGTLPWMAPEILNGSSSLVSEKVDVFSFGIVMWELLTGEEPYADLHYGSIIGGIVSNTLRPPIPESCDPEWRSLMERCWSAEPSERPNFTEIANKLRLMAASVPPKAQVQLQTTVPAQVQK